MRLSLSKKKQSGSDSFIRLIRPEWVFLVFFLLMATMSAILIPVGAGLDEPSHIARVEQLGHGVIAPQPISRSEVDWRYSDDAHTTDELYGGYSDYALIATSVSNMRDYHLGVEPYRFPTWETPRLQSFGNYGDKTIGFVFSNAAINSPLAYFPQIVAFVLSSLITENVWAIIIAMRLAGIISFGVSIYFCIHYIPIGKWLLVVLGLLPATIEVNSQVTADMMTSIVCIGFISAVFCAMCTSGKLSTMNQVVLMSTGCLLGVVKPTYLPLIILIGMIIMWNKSLRNQSTYIKISCLIVISLLMFAMWYHFIGSINTGAMYSSAINPDEQKTLVISHPFFFAKRLVVVFMQQNIMQIGDYGPLAAHGGHYGSGWPSVLLLMISAMFHDDREVSLYRRSKGDISRCIVACYLVFCMVFVLISTALYLQFSAVGSLVISGVQNRYFIPIMLLAVLPFSVIHNWYIPNTNEIQYEKKILLHFIMLILFIISFLVMFLDLIHILFGFLPKN